MKTLTTATRTAVEGREVKWCLLVNAGFDVGPVYMTNAPITISWGGQEYLGGGKMLGIKLPREDGSLAANKGELILDGLDAAAISLAFNERTENVSVLVRMLVFDKNAGTLTGDIFLGRYTMSEVRVTPPTSAEQSAKS